MKDYFLYELATDEFESLVNHICQNILGIGLISFCEGPDGGKDGKFEGTANHFPDESKPWSGKFIIQAKRTTKINASCSDPDFDKLLDKEIPKMQVLKNSGELDNYIVFTNRKLSANKQPHLEKKLRDGIGIYNVCIIGNETLGRYLDTSPQIVDLFGLNRFRNPLRIYPNDLKDLIVHFHENRVELIYKLKDYSLNYVKLEKKNEINKLGNEYFTLVKERSNPHFFEIDDFLGNPANELYISYYENIIDEIQAKIINHRFQFDKFEEIFEYLYDFMLGRCPELREKRRLIHVFLHYMYCNCDIGKKEYDKT